MDNSKDETVSDWKPFYRDHVFALVDDADLIDAAKNVILGTQVTEDDLKI